MNITKTEENGKLIISVAGRIDTTTAPILDSEIKSSLNGITSLELNFKDLDYISSAGLRVLLSTHKQMIKQNCEMVITNINDTVSEIFDVTGFSDILTIK